MKLKRSWFIVVVLVGLSFGHEAQAASVSVTLPNFTVELNGQSMDNRYSRYPFVSFSRYYLFSSNVALCR